MSRRTHSRRTHHRKSRVRRRKNPGWETLGIGLALAGVAAYFYMRSKQGASTTTTTTVSGGPSQLAQATGADTSSLSNWLTSNSLANTGI